MLLAGFDPVTQFKNNDKRKSFLIRITNGIFKKSVRTGIFVDDSEIDHNLELQRVKWYFMQAFEKLKNAGKQENFETMAKAVSDDTPNENEDKDAVGKILNASSNLWSVTKFINRLKGFVTKQAQKVGRFACLSWSNTDRL